MKRLIGTTAILGLIVGLFGLSGLATASRQAVTAPGGHASCTVDAAGYCTVKHNLGAKPAGVVVTADRIGQLGTTDQFTATTFRVRWWWYEPVMFKAGTKIDFSWVPAGVAGGSTPSPSPTATKPPTTSTPSPSPTETPTSPSATPTETPTGTPTATESPVKTCTNPGFTTWSDDNNGEYRSMQDGYFLFNDMWNNHTGGNNGPTGKYEMYGCSYDNWYELVTQADSPTGAVRAYPKVGRDYDTLKPLAQVLSSKFAASSPHCAGCAYNVAYDVWINFDLENELMIWTDWQNQTPAGDKVDTVTIGGHQYEVWKTDSVTTKGGIFTYRSVDRQLSGTMDLQAFFNDLKRRGWINRVAGETYDGVKQLNFGVEVVSTKNTKQRFDFTDFSISES